MQDAGLTPKHQGSAHSQTHGIEQGAERRRLANSIDEDVAAGWAGYFGRAARR